VVLPWFALETALVEELALLVGALLVAAADAGVVVDVLELDPVLVGVVEVVEVESVDVVEVVEVAAWLAVPFTPATRPTVASPATAAVLHPAMRVRRSRRSAGVAGSVFRGSGVFMPATMRPGGSGPHHDNVKPLLSLVRRHRCPRFQPRYGTTQVPAPELVDSENMTIAPPSIDARRLRRNVQSADPSPSSDVSPIRSCS
jgi:hypothetical protein